MFYQRCIAVLMLFYMTPSPFCANNDHDVSDYCPLPEDPVLGLEGFISKSDHFHKVFVFLNPAELVPQTSQLFDAPLFSDCGYKGKEQYGFVPGTITEAGVRQQSKLGHYVADIYMKHFNNNETKFMTCFCSPVVQSNMAFFKGFKDVIINLDGIRHATLMTNSEQCFTCNKSTNQYSYKLSEHILKALKLEKSDDENIIPWSTLLYLMCNIFRNNNVVHCKRNIRNECLEILKMVNKNYSNASKMGKRNLHNGCVDILLMQLIQQMKSKLAPKTLVIYQLDDTIFSTLLSSVTAEEMQIPRPSSRLVFEVYSRKSTRHMRLKVLFNGKDITSNVPLCHRYNKNEQCNLKYFTDYHRINSRKMKIET